jgi:hypothetical protein
MIDMPIKSSRRATKRAIKRASKRTTRRHRRKMRGGNYRMPTYNGFPKNKGEQRMYYPGGSATYEEYKQEVAGGLEPIGMQ